MSKTKHQIPMALWAMLTINVLAFILSVGSVLGLYGYLPNQPKFIGDASVYKYRVVISSIFFDPAKEVTAQKPDAVRHDKYEYYTNEYSVRDTGDFNSPLAFTMGIQAEFKKGEDGNYHLIVHNNSYFSNSPSSALNVTVVEQSSKKVVFNSTVSLAAYYGP